MKPIWSKPILLLACIILLSSSVGCKDIAGNIKARFGKMTERISTASPAGKFGSTAEEKAMINAVTEKYGDLQQSGDPRILELMVSSSVVNHIPADRVSQFSSNAPKFHAWFIYDNFNEGTVSVEWLYLDDNYSIGTLKAKSGKDFGRGAFILEAPDDGWPLGKYRVKVSGQGVTEQVDFQVIKSNTVSTAILLPDGGVDLAGSGSPAGRTAKTGSITTDKSTALASKTIGSSGGSIVISKPGDPLDGMELVVPPNSYKNAREFKISSAPINSHEFGEHFNPLTPMIIVENGGDYADELITVKIPVKIPDDQFAMAFLYDDNSKTLEGMTVVGIEDNAIRVATRHFSRFTVSGILNSVLENLIQEEIDSGYTPGVDDWQFVNYGSYISPGGNCFAQSNTTIWYYCQQPDGGGAKLYGRYDNNFNERKTPGFQFDDSLAYRFVSVIQASKGDEFSNFANKLLHETQGMSWILDQNKQWVTIHTSGISDANKRKLFAYAMQLTGEPQNLGVWTEGGIGHSLVVYRITSDKLHIADPNYPGNTGMAMRYRNNGFEPYQTAEKETGLDKLGVSKLDKLRVSKLDKLGMSKLDKLGESKLKGQSYWKYSFYYSSRAVTRWDLMAQQWQELKAGKAGDGLFPKYKLMYYTGEDFINLEMEKRKPYPLEEGTVLKDMWIYPVAVFDDGSPEQHVALYQNGKWLDYIEGFYCFEPGKHSIGVAIQKKVQDSSSKLKQDGSNNFRYVDFKYIKVTSPATVTIQPPRIMIYEMKGGATEVTHDFTAVAEPDGIYYYEWDFDDGAAFSDGDRKEGEKATVSHTYENLKAGDKFYPTVELYNYNFELLAKDTISITIEGGEQPPADGGFRYLKPGEKYVDTANQIEVTLLSVKRVPRSTWQPIMTSNERFLWTSEDGPEGYAVLRYKAKLTTGEIYFGSLLGHLRSLGNNVMYPHSDFSPSSIRSHYNLLPAVPVTECRECTMEAVFPMPENFTESIFGYMPDPKADQVIYWKLPIDDMPK